MEFCCRNDSIVWGDQFPVYDATCVAKIEFSGIYGLQNSLYHDIEQFIMGYGKILHYYHTDSSSWLIWKSS